MMRYGHWLRTGIGTVVGLKLLGVLPLLVVLLAGNDTGAIPTASPARALAADAGAGKHDAQAPASPARADLLRIPGDGPSATFAVESRGVQELVEALQRRSAELSKRDTELDRREAAIAVAEKGLEKRIAHLEKLTAGVVKGRPAAGGFAGAGSPAVPGSAMEELGKIYGAMKAEEAAPLFDRLDTQTVYAIFKYMKQRQISAVLPLMNPDKAVELTELLGGRRRAKHGDTSPSAGRPSS